MKKVKHTEPKSHWLKYGIAKEYEFIFNFCPIAKLSARINPARAKNVYAPDIVVGLSEADLKYQAVPFFRAKKLFNIDPQYAVAFNYKDYDNYKNKYDHIDIYFWVEWLETEKRIGKKLYSVKPMRGLWRTSFVQIANWIENGKVELHEYQQRKKDTGDSSKFSFILDLLKMECLYLDWSNDIIQPIFLDIETTGLTPKNGYVPLEIAMCLNSGEEMSVLIRPTLEQWENAHPKALEVNGFTWDDVKKGISIADVKYKIINFINKNNLKQNNSIFVGQNPDFDLNFLDHYFGMDLEFVKAPLRQRLDVRDMYRSLCEVGMLKPLDSYSGKSISQALKSGDEPEPHRALEGAKVVMRNYNKIYAIIKECLEKEI